MIDISAEAIGFWPDPVIGLTETKDSERHYPPFSAHTAEILRNQQQENI